MLPAMHADTEDLRARLEALIAERAIPGRIAVTADGGAITAEITDIPFTHHGMRFTRIVVLCFTLDPAPEGRLRTAWGKRDWNRGELVLEERESADHASFEPAAAWLLDRMVEHAK